MTVACSTSESRRIGQVSKKDYRVEKCSPFGTSATFCFHSLLRVSSGTSEIASCDSRRISLSFSLALYFSLVLLSAVKVSADTLRHKPLQFASRF